MAGHGAVLAWDRALTANVDAECELGVVIGRTASAVSAAVAMEHVFGFTIINDVSSRDPWLDGDQWLLGKSMPGFCPVGPWIVTRDELEADGLALGCTLNGDPIQDGTTDLMHFRDPRGHRLPQPAHGPATGRPDRDGDPAPARLPAGPGPAPRAG